VRERLWRRKPDQRPELSAPPRASIKDDSRLAKHQARLPPHRSCWRAPQSRSKAQRRWPKTLSSRVSPSAAKCRGRTRTRMRRTKTPPRQVLTSAAVSFSRSAERRGLRIRSLHQFPEWLL